MKKCAMVIAMTISFCICLSACSIAPSGLNSIGQDHQEISSTATQLSSAHATSSRTENTTSLPDLAQLEELLTEEIQNIGAGKITGDITFNPNEISTDNDSFLIAYISIPTEIKPVVANLIYLYNSKSWALSSIRDYENPNIYYSASDQDDVNIYDIKTGELLRASKSHRNKEKLPGYYENLVSKYNAISKEHQLAYTISESYDIEHGEAYRSDYNTYFYFSIFDDSGNDERWQFFTDEKGEYSKSISATFYEDFSNEAVKDFIAATILIATNSDDISSAKEKAQSMSNELTDGSYSHIENVGEYSVFIGRHVPWSSMVGSSISVHMVATEETNQPIDKSEYIHVSSADLRSPLNKDMNAYVTVKVKDQAYELAQTDLLDVVDEAGESFNVFYRLEDFAVTFDPEKTYTFYGKVADHSLASLGSGESMTGLRLKYWEEVKQN